MKSQASLKQVAKVPRLECLTRVPISGLTPNSLRRCRRNETVAGGRRSGYWTTRGYANSRTGRLVDWTSRGLNNSRNLLDNSRTGQLADATGDFACLVFVGGICETASCPVRDLSSPRDVQSASWQSASWRIRELSSTDAAVMKSSQHSFDRFQNEHECDISTHC